MLSSKWTSPQLAALSRHSLPNGSTLVGICAARSPVTWSYLIVDLHSNSFLVENASL
jgi:hypothetical protein